MFNFLTNKTFVTATLLTLAIAGVVWLFLWDLDRQTAETEHEPGVSIEDEENGSDLLNGEESLAPQARVETVIENLNIPWEIAFLPPQPGSGQTDGGILVTERSGALAIIRNGNISRISVQGVYHAGEGGLLGMALHPEFESNRFIYLYMTYRDGNQTRNKVERYRFENDTLLDRTVIIDNIPGASNHNGGRIAFGPPKSCESGQADCHLYITTGDSGNSSLAQNASSLAGKILRLTDDGSIPSDNFRGAVHAYGIRNSQGITWDDAGRLWSTDHGRSGVLSGLDELNLIEGGKNYGWPLIQGYEMRPGMTVPVIHSGVDKTWAPAGIAFNNGSLFWGGLRGRALYEIRVDGASVSGLREHFLGEFGRIRAVATSLDGFIYITTSNTDGRGNPHMGDDKLIKINPNVFD